MDEMQDLRPLLKKIVEGGRTLRAEEAHAAIGAMLDGDVADVEIAALLTALAQSYELAGHRVCCTASIGVVDSLRHYAARRALKRHSAADPKDIQGNSGAFSASNAI